jgi:hypothetical protein
MSATRLLERLYKAVNGAFYAGGLPADAVVEDARIGPGVLGTWNDRTHRLRVDMPKSRRERGPVYVFTHEAAHALTPQLSHEDCHNHVFQREHERLLGELLNGIKKRERKFDRGDHPGVRRTPAPLGAPLPASTIGSAIFGGPKHRHSSEDTVMLKPAHHARRELPGPDGCTGADHFRRILAFERALERKIPGGSRWISGYKPFVDSRGFWQPGASLSRKPGPLRVSVAREISRQRMNGGPR